MAGALITSIIALTSTMSTHRYTHNPELIIMLGGLGCSYCKNGGYLFNVHA